MANIIERKVLLKSPSEFKRHGEGLKTTSASAHKLYQEEGKGKGKREE